MDPVLWVIDARLITDMQAYFANGYKICHYYFKQ